MECQFKIGYCDCTMLSEYSILIQVRHSPLDPPPMEYHGDGISIWKWTLSSTSPIIQQLILSSDYFKELNESQVNHTENKKNVDCLEIYI